MKTRKVSARRARRANAVAPFEPLEGRTMFNSTPFALSGGTFTQDWSNNGLITANNNWSGVPSIEGYSQDNGLAAGTDPSGVTGAGTLGALNVLANQTTPQSNGGLQELPGVVGFQGSSSQDAPSLLIYLDTTNRENVSVSYKLRQLDTDPAVQPVALQYRVGNSGAFTNVPAGFVADASAGQGVEVSVSNIALPAAVANQPLVQVRILTTDATGTDSLIGVDDINITSTAIVGQTVGFAGTATPASENAGTFNLPVSRGPGTTGTVTVDYTITPGTATNPEDFTGSLTGTVTITPGNASAPIAIPIVNDSAIEPQNSFTVTLSNATGANIGTGSTVVTINDDDKPTGGKLISAGPLSQDWSSTAGQIINDDDWSGVPYFTGYRGDDLTTTTGGTDPQTITASLTDTPIDVNANKDEIYLAMTGAAAAGTGGVAEIETWNDPVTSANNPLVTIKGSNDADAPFLLFEVNTTGVNSVDVAYDLRDVDSATNNSNPSPVALQYRVGNTGSWTNVGAAFVPDATPNANTSGDTTHVSATFTSAVTNQPLVQFRILTYNAIGADEYIGVDNILVRQTPVAPGALQFAKSTVTTANEGSIATLDVIRTGGSAGTVTVGYTANSGSATSGSDFPTTTGTLTFADGETSKSIQISLTDDGDAETLENFTVSLSGAGGGATVGTPSTASVNIVDNDYVKLANGPLTQDWNNINLINADDNWSGVLGIRGYRGDGLTSEIDADAQTITASGTDTPIDVNANILDPGSFTSGGVTEFDQLIDPTVGLAGSATADAPFLLFEADTTGVQAVRVQYRVRDLESGADNAPQQVALQYRVGNTGTWTNVPAAYIADATTGPNTVGPDNNVDVTVAGAVANKPLVQFRVITVNALNNDEWVGIDDISLSATTPPALPDWVTGNATWNEPILTINGAATIVADPAAYDDNPQIVASGEAATLTIDPDSGLVIHAQSLALSGGASATVASLGGARTAANHLVVVLKALTVDANSMLDITDNDVIVDYDGDSPVGPIETRVNSAFVSQDNPWSGKGITSTVAQNDSNYTVGVGDNGALSQPFGSAYGGALFDGLELDDTTVIIKFTYTIDITLDGKVNGDDAQIFSTNYSAGDAAFFSIGDIDHSGLFTSDDAQLFATFYDSTLSPV